jgi:hypothetical protein
MISEKMLELLCIYAVLKDNPSMDITNNTYMALTVRRDELESEFIKYIEDKFNYKRKG